MSSLRTIPVALESRGYDVGVWDETSDPSWDAFLAEAAGDYPQTSMWAHVKSGSNYLTRRVMVKQRGTIVAGAQLLVRSLPIGGAFGYVPLGRVLRSENLSLAMSVLDQIRQLAKKERIRFLAVQAPWRSQTMACALRDAGFSVPCSGLAPTASLLINLSSDLSIILSHMMASTRN